MVIFGTLKSTRPTETGSILFEGELEACRNFLEQLNKDDFENLNICEDNGTIFERVI